MPRGNAPDLRKAVFFAIVAIAGLVVGYEFSHRHPDVDAYRIASWGCAAVVLVFGIAATRSAASEIAETVSARAGAGASTSLRVMVRIVGYLMTVLAVLAVLQIDLTQFLVGGVLTGVILGIAAQQALGNFFAGLVLLLARPYEVGDHLTIFSGAINGPHEGTVSDVGLIYTSVQTADGVLSIPNSVVLGSAVRPSRP